MPDDKNSFGGGVAHSLYTPMSEDEREVLDRLITSDDMMINILGWGHINRFDKVTLGDLRLGIQFTAAFDQPALPIPVHYFDLELVTRGGWVLARQRQPVLYGNQPIQIGAGDVLTMVWDIAIRQMDPQFVKMIKPGAIGLTTAEGNRRLDEHAKKLLQKLRHGEEHMKKQDALKRAKAEAMEREAIKKGLIKKK